MTSAKITEIIKFLEAVRKRPNMSVLNFNIEAMEALIHGFNVGCYLCEEKLFPQKHKEIKDNVTIEREWHLKPVSVTYEMKERGLSDEEIIQELLTIEIEAWSKVQCED